MKTIVLARFNEDCSWINSLSSDYNVCIQNKGNEINIENKKVEICNIKNIGLDQYCYLEYIVSHYDNLPNEILFTQANFYDHLDVINPRSDSIRSTIAYTNMPSPDISIVSKMSATNIMDTFFKQIYIHGYTTNAKIYKTKNNLYSSEYFNAHPSFRITSEPNCQLSMKEWFEKYVEMKMPSVDDFVWFKNGIFGVKKAYILSRPKIFYENIMNSITHVRECILHYIERSWYYMLNIHMPLPHSFKNTMNIFYYIFNRLDNIVCESGQSFVEGSLFFFGNQDMKYNDVFIHKQLNLFHLAKDAKNILEIGFNAGHSTALMLLANPNSKILHFDLNEHLYVKKCYEYLKAVFGEHRFIEFISGDSQKTLPEYLNSDKIKSFDLIHVDGGHTDEIATSDINNTIKLLEKDGIIVIDDYNMDNLKNLVNTYKNDGILKDCSNDICYASHYDQYYHFIGKLA